MPPVLVVVNIMGRVGASLQITWLVGCSTSAVGLTVIVKVFAGPSQVTDPFSKYGVTTIVAVTGAVPGLVAVNDAISPVPLAASPIDVSSFVQV